MSWVEKYFIAEYIQENNMYGYIFETTNKKTGETYLGKRYAVSFDKNYFGEEVNDKLAVAIEKYGRPSFSVKMIMVYETPEAVDAAFEEMQKSQKKVVEKKDEPVEKEPAEKPPVKVKSTKKKSVKKED